VSKRKLYLEALLQWAESLTLCDLLVKIGSIHLFDLLVLVCLDWMTVASTLDAWTKWKFSFHNVSLC
jgi:hypothetical protein